jgi:hypothetical protein
MGAGKMFKKILCISCFVLLGLTNIECIHAKHFDGGASHGYSRTIAPKSQPKNAPHAPIKNNFNCGKLLTALGIGDSIS